MSAQSMVEIRATPPRQRVQHFADGSVSVFIERDHRPEPVCLATARWLLADCHLLRRLATLHGPESELAWALAKLAADFESLAMALLHEEPTS